MQAFLGHPLRLEVGDAPELVGPIVWEACKIGTDT
jgi:hypothetical protein